MRLRIPLILTFIVGTFTVLAYFIPERHVHNTNLFLEDNLIIISGFALLLGVVSVVQSNIRKIKKREPGWAFAMVLLVGLVFMTFVGIGFGIEEGTFFYWIFINAFTPLSSTVFSLLAFYIASAAYRAFRARSWQATVLLGTAVFVMLGRIPFGEMISPAIPRITEWIMDTPNLVAQRGIIIGAALGAAAMSIRIILGIERSYLGT